MFVKLIKAMLTISFVVLAFTVKVNAAEQLSPEQFSDLPSGWSREAMVSAINNGFYRGYDGKVHPKNYLTRAQLASVVNRAFGTSISADISNYIDVPPNAWYTDDVSKAVGKRTMIGANNKMFPQRDATREEVFVVLSRAVSMQTSLDVSSLEQFSDYQDVAFWAVNDVAAMVENGYMSTSEGKLLPKAKITREEFAYVLGSFSEYYVNNNSEELVSQFVTEDTHALDEFYVPPDTNSTNEFDETISEDFIYETTTFDDEAIESINNTDDSDAGMSDVNINNSAENENVSSNVQEAISNIDSDKLNNGFAACDSGELNISVRHEALICVSDYGGGNLAISGLPDES